MKRAIGLGAGGHARVVIEILRAAETAEIVALLDPRPELHGTEVLGVTVAGGDEELTAQRDRGVDAAFVGVGSVGDTSLRRRLFELICGAGLEPLTSIHPAAVVSPSAVRGEGLTVMATATVNAGARLGHNVVVNTGAIVEHDCTLHDHVYVASGARLAAGVAVGEGAHVGLGASVKQGVEIGAGAVVGSGAVVIGDVPAGAVVAGVPARPLREPAA